jgi:hypothetical protein
MTWWNVRDPGAPVQAGPMAPTAPQVPEGAGQQEWFPPEQHLRTELPEAHAGGGAPELPLSKGFVVLSLQQCHRTVVPDAFVGNQTWKLPPLAGLVLPNKLQHHRTCSPYRKSGPQTSTAHGLCSPVPAAAAMVPGSPSRPQGLCCLVGTRWFKPGGFPGP